MSFGKKSKKPESVNIPTLKIENIKVKIVGDSALICHAWSEKAKAMMLAKQTGEAGLGKEPKNPYQDFCNSLYWLTEKPKGRDITEADLKAARFGFPAIGLKASAVEAATTVDGISMAEARRAFHVPVEYVEIKGDLHMREDMVRVGMGTADIRHRGAFDPWTMTVPIKFRPDVLTAAQIINLFNLAGFSVGIGEWRSAKDGSFGLFHVSGKAD